MCVIGNFNVYVNYIYIYIYIYIYTFVIDTPAGKFHIKISNIVDCTFIDELDLRTFVA